MLSGYDVTKDHVGSHELNVKVAWACQSGVYQSAVECIQRVFYCSVCHCESDGCAGYIILNCLAWLDLTGLATQDYLASARLDAQYWES